MNMTYRNNITYRGPRNYVEISPTCDNKITTANLTVIKTLHLHLLLMGIQSNSVLKEMVASRMVMKIMTDAKKIKVTEKVTQAEFL